MAPLKQLNLLLDIYSGSVILGGNKGDKMKKMTQREIDKMWDKTCPDDAAFAKKIKAKGFKQNCFSDHAVAVDFLMALLQKNGIGVFVDPSAYDIGFLVRKK